MGQKLQAGDRVSIEGGELAGKRGTIIPRLSISFTHGRHGSIPQIEGATEPLGIHDQLVRLDNGKVVAIHQDRLTKKPGDDHPLTGVA
jgi:hypothetical protein